MVKYFQYVTKFQLSYVNINKIKVNTAFLSCLSLTQIPIVLVIELKDEGPQ
jgi:hypothetical protein